MDLEKSLSIIIPAYNEEEAIQGTIESCLSAFPVIQRQAQLERIELIVVSDGSTDRTVTIIEALIAEYSDDSPIRLIAYQQNKGYGAAIKTGFQAATGDYLGFLDGDGTCDPAFFGALIREMTRKSASIALGSRLHDESSMPLVRRIGNTVFAKLLALLSGTHVRDSASGMRVLTRECLAWVVLLPDGLHFTPAMSAMAAFDAELDLIELPMPYAERQGTSKLRVMQDGVRFLQVILKTAYLYSPFRFFAIPGLFLLAFSLILVYPEFLKYLQVHAVPEWAFYRLYVSAIIFLVGLNSLMFGIVAHHFSYLIRNRNYKTVTRLSRRLDAFLSRFSLPLGGVLIGLGIYVTREAFLSYILYQEIFLHWSRIVFGGLLCMTGVTAWFYVMLYRLLELLYRQKVLLKEIKI